MVFAGTGTVRANGGASSASAGGSGGRVSFEGVGSNTFSGTLQVYGGSGLPRDYAGTINLDPALRALFHGDMADQGRKLMQMLGLKGGVPHGEGGGGGGGSSGGGGASSSW
jgi:hypothetical protein